MLKLLVVALPLAMSSPLYALYNHPNCEEPPVRLVQDVRGTTFESLGLGFLQYESVVSIIGHVPDCEQIPGIDSILGEANLLEQATNGFNVRLYDSENDGDGNIPYAGRWAKSEVFSGSECNSYYTIATTWTRADGKCLTTLPPGLNTEIDRSYRVDEDNDTITVTSYEKNRKCDDSDPANLGASAEAGTCVETPELFFSSKTTIVEN
eukprot:Lithocolla_globosa_v1_NODE_85_length_6671_cov_4.306832.p4 type:complete len:208 gc:universal NODE_85_length_6671_cov_4.306832:3196-3819(+)